MHFPVSGISISRSLFFVPAHDSSGFLWILVFSEEFFHRNLLLAGVRKFRFLALLKGILHRFLYIPAFDLDSSKFLQNPPDSSGIPPEFLFPPKLSGDKLGSSACIAAMGCYDWAPPTLLILIAHPFYIYLRCFIYFICG